MKYAGSIWTTIAGIAVAALGGASPACSRAAPLAVPLDGERVVGDIGVACTGIGQEKSDPRWKAYPIRIEASNPAGDLLADVEISLSGKGGAVLASVTCAGPWIMLRPPPGAYRLEGWIPGSGLRHQVTSVSPPASGQRVVALFFAES
jgi:hypothetical protein